MAIDNKNSSEESIDLLVVFQNLWRNRGLIIKTGILFFLIGLTVAILSPKEYTASSLMIPQLNEKGSRGNLGSLAALAGINIGASGGEILSPFMYPKILYSVPFQKDLMKTTINLNHVQEPVTLFEYFTDQKYRKFNFIASVKKYTIGLPGLVKNLFRKENLSPVSPGTVQNSSIYIFSRSEKQCADAISRQINLIVDSKEGYIKIVANMPEALAAAQLAESVQNLLQEYIKEFRTEKVQQNLNFVQERYNEIEKDFENIQTERALFRDANRNLISAKAQTEQERLDARYNILLTVYTELSRQLEQAKIEVKENTPVLTVIDPVSLPLDSSKPRRIFIVVTFTMGGIILGMILVVFLKFIKSKTQSGFLNKWII